MKCLVLILAALCAASYGSAEEFNPAGSSDIHATKVLGFIERALEKIEDIFIKQHASHQGPSRTPAADPGAGADDDSSPDEDSGPDFPFFPNVHVDFGLDSDIHRNKESRPVSDDSSSNTSSSSSSEEDELFDDTDGEEEHDPHLGIGFPAIKVGNFGGLFGSLFSTPSNVVWWKGPNVCVDRVETDLNPELQTNRNESESSDSIRLTDLPMMDTYHFSSCQQTPKVYECTTRVSNNGVRKEYTVTYRCCHGSRRVLGKPGCTEVNTKNMLQTVESVGAPGFAKLIESSGLKSSFEQPAQNFTVFAPTDEAVRDYMDTLLYSNEVDVRMRRQLAEVSLPPEWNALVQAALSERAERTERAQRDLLNMEEGLLLGLEDSDSSKALEEEEPKGTLIRNHQVMRLLDLEDTCNDQVLESARNGSLIRINSIVGPQGRRSWMANCARVVKANNEATGGMVHLVDRVLPYVTREQTIANLLEKDPRLSTFRKLLESHGLMEIVNGSGPLTVLAPTNDAFFQMDDEARKRLLEKGGCADSILRQLIVRHTVCAGAVQPRLLVRNLEGEYLNLEHRDGKLYVNGVEVIDRRDNVASNGVLHVIDKYIIPQSAQSIPDLMKSRNMTQWNDLLEKTGIMEMISHTSNITLFVPTSAALTKSESERLIFDDSPEGIARLRQILLYHIGHPSIEEKEFGNGQLIPTEADGKSLHLRPLLANPLLHIKRRATVECGRIVSSDNKACGAVVHMVDRLLTPPTQTLGDIIRERPDMSVLRSIMNGTEFMELLQDEPKRGLTFLGLTDSSFESMSGNFIRTLRADPELAKKFISSHLLPNSLCCSSVGEILWPFFTVRVKSMNPRISHEIQRDRLNRLHIGGGRVVECDVMATNGILLVLDQSAVAPRALAHPLGINVKTESGKTPNVEVVLHGV